MAVRSQSSSKQAEELEPQSSGVYRGPVIDCDVHHTWASEKDLLPYLSEGWREYVLGRGDGSMIPLTTPRDFPQTNSPVRTDASQKDGRPAGSDLGLLQEQLLDRFNVEKALLTFDAGLFGINRLRNPYFAAAVASAANDWNIDNWLARDSRLMGSILVSNHLPDEAAKEIRRLAGHPQIAQVIMTGNAIGQTIGHPLFHPIYEAAAETGLPLALHGGGVGVANPPAAGGFIHFYLEYHTAMTQPVMTNLVSLIVHGVFEKFPGLKVLLVEGGVAWVPPLLWRLDSDFKGLRRETPWLKKLPSEYFREHFRLTTQPMELPAKRSQLIEILQMFEGDRMLLYSTDYPHWDTDERDFIAGRLPREWRRRIFYENALEFYGWQPQAADGVE